MVRFPWNPIVVLTVVAALVLTSLVPSKAAQPRRGGALRIAHIGDPPTLDQHWTTVTITRDIMNNVNEGLFAFNTKMEPKPMLVDRWTMSPDRRTYTFVLRRGVRFHHGRELNSEDVRASLDRWGRIAGAGRALFSSVLSVETPDPLTITLRLREPFATLIQELAFFAQAAVIFPKEVIEEAGTGRLRRLIGTGPYRFVEHLPDRHIRLDRFEGYTSRSEEPDGTTGRKSAFFDSILFLPVPDAAVRISGVKSGDYHFADSIPSDEFARLRADRDMVPLVDESPRWLHAVFNHRSPLMSNQKIRQAFQAALDHDAVMRAAFGPSQFWRLDPGIMSKEHFMWTDVGREFYNRNSPERSRQLLAEAGYKGEPLRWLTTMEYPHFGIAAQVSKPMLERAGFSVDLQMMDWATLISRRGRPDLWDVFVTAHGLRPDPTQLLPLDPTWSGWYDHRDMRAMIGLMRRHSDPKVRHDLWVRMQRLFYEDAASIKFGDFFPLHLHRRELRGYISRPTHVWWNSWLETTR